MNAIKVTNMTSSKGNKIANQFIIESESGAYFQSYDTIIAFKSKPSGKVYLDADAWDYSPITGKYRNVFLGETKQETMKKIKSGEYTLVNLN